MYDNECAITGAASMTKMELDGATVEFDDIEDDAKFTDAAAFQLALCYQRWNRDVFDNELPQGVRVRWGKITGPMANRSIAGWLCDHDASGHKYIFIDDRLRIHFLSFPFLVDLVLIHEMCHLKVSGHGPEFIRELFTALERLSWNPLLGVCAPYTLAQILSCESDVSGAPAHEDQQE
jgi:hypothetical protein